MRRNAKPFVFLAYSSEWDSGGRNTDEPVRVFSREWKQLQIFTSMGPDTLVFLRPDDSTDVVATLKRLQVKHIVDIREVPYLTFDRLDRSSFFDALANTLIDYIGMHELMHAQGADSLLPLLQDFSPQQQRGGRDLLKEALSERIGNGPTAVFCDSDPKRDDKVGVLLDFLARRQIRHAPVLAVGAD